MKMKRSGRAARHDGLGAIVGLLAAATALGVGQFVAGLTGADGSPVVAVGQLQIDFTPPWLKNFAITAFGPDDKTILVGGILVVIALFAALIGMIAMQRLSRGMAGLAVFAIVGLTAAATRPNASFASLLPTLAATAAAAAVLRFLIPLAEQQAQRHRIIWAPNHVGWTKDPGDAWDADPDEGPETGDQTASVDLAEAADQGKAADAGEAPKQPEAADQAEGPDLPVAPDLPRVPDLPVGLGRPGAQGRPGAPGGMPDESRSGGQDTGDLEEAGPRRRSFLKASAATVGIAAGAGLAGRLLAERASVTTAQKTLRIPKPTSLAKLPPGVNLDVPGISPFVTSNSAFYRVDTAISLPQVDPSSWQLRIHGMVEREVTLTFDELIKRPLIEDYITLCCVSDPVGGPYISNALWLGTKLSSLLREAGIKAGADQLMCTSVDGFTSGTPVQTVMDGRDALLAVAMNGTALPVAHGFPARMVVPGLYGYVSATKWVTDINVTTFAGNYAYWAQRGWSQQAPIKTECRIDVPTGTNQLKEGRTAIAGVAWAQHKGIDAVHVRVDKGPWNQATLATVPGIDTWRQWSWEWDAPGGNHTIEARATDATGYTQTSVLEAVEPNGASGYPMVAVTVG
jgi:DMSO/TMAO reductase YedYZ molybdopterin-dependent catalytic subunit